MLPVAEGLVRGLEFFARRHGRRPSFDLPGITAAMAHAARLAEDDERAEPAALFFACSLRSRAFGVAAQLAIPFLTRSQAWTIGLDLDVKDVELDVLRARVLFRAIEFPELRDWFAARLRAAPGAT
jgi:hypothetical protein